MVANFASGTVWTGDNLPIMRGMNDACIDLIYLDPPFNSNRHYEAPTGSKAAGAAFKDAWTLNDIDVYEHGELADRNPAAYSVIWAARQAHGKGMQSYLIMMAVRLLEMRRVLKPSGSIYLHCDPTASHYLKLLMDGIFGRRNFRNEIIWKRRQDAHNLASKTMGAAHDVILWYGDVGQALYRRQFTPYDKKYLKTQYKHSDQRGKYRILPCTNETGRNARYEFRGVSRAWRFSADTMQKMFDDDLIVQLRTDGPFYYKKYLEDAAGVPVQDVWVDVPPARGTEQLGYPTQKPLALLERIILASSDPEDMILDPFCGCATALVAADRLQRKWAGIDLSKLAVQLVNDRIADDRGLWGGAIVPELPPQRTDPGKLPDYRTHRHRLYGEQEGMCIGCSTHFPFRVMDVDHRLSRADGGTDHPDNLQLLCSGCNRSKGRKSMAEWMATRRTTNPGIPGSAS